MALENKGNGAPGSVLVVGVGASRGVVAAIALRFARLHSRHRSAWCHEIDLRPWTETF